MTEQEQIRKVVRLLVSCHRQMNDPSPRERVLSALRLAWSECPDPERFMKKEPNPDDSLISAEGMFRLVASFNNEKLSDPYIQERYAKMVTDSLDEMGV